MNSATVRRFIILMVFLTIGVFMATSGYDYFNPPPGDYEVRQGNILLDDKKFDEALAAYNLALKKTPNHRGALMGLAITYIKMENYPKAMAELTDLIKFLIKTDDPEDLTGRGVLAAAYANRGIVHDRTGRYKKALADYIAALTIDEESVAGPDLVHKILYGRPDASTVRKRAKYIQEQLKLPKEKRFLRLPERDAKQRMHRP